MDLQGPKLRLGEFAAGSVELRKGLAFRLDSSPEPGDSTRVLFPHPEVLGVMEEGMDILIDDGKLRLCVSGVGDNFVDTLVVVGGKVSARKGVSVPRALLPFSALTDKDRVDLAFGLELGVDWIALSFVQRPEDVAEVKLIVENRAWIMSKLETPASLDRLEEIVDLSDGIMVARGDLGVEICPEQVPVLQRRIIDACRAAGKPVVVATQMLESMTGSPVPTRAEASDVATAIYSGADAVMLSAESATGSYPLETVQIMDRIVKTVEADIFASAPLERSGQTGATLADSVCASLATATTQTEIVGAVAYTSLGKTSLRLAKQRIKVPTIVLTPNLSTARRMSMVWGSKTFCVPDVSSVEGMINGAAAIAKQELLAGNGDIVAIVAGLPFGQTGTTNLLYMHRMAAPLM